MGKILRVMDKCEKSSILVIQYLWPFLKYSDLGSQKQDLSPII